jgi:hypothetical protein
MLNLEIRHVIADVIALSTAIVDAKNVTVEV